MGHLPCRCTTATVARALSSYTQRPSECWDSHTSQSVFLLASLLFTSLCRICVATSNSDTKRCWQVTRWAMCFILMKQIHLDDEIGAVLRSINKLDQVKVKSGQGIHSTHEWCEVIRPPTPPPGPPEVTLSTGDSVLSVKAMTTRRRIRRSRHWA